jgi:hypothetical protein
MEAADHRLARRVRIGARFVLYPTLLALIAIAWHARSSGAETHTGGMWKGFTSQDQEISALISADGVLTHLDTHLIEECSDGSPFDLRWFPYQNRFVQHGEEVRGHSAFPINVYPGQTDQGAASLDGRIGGHPHGTIRSSNTLTRPGHIPLQCESGPVTFTLKRA